MNNLFITIKKLFQHDCHKHKKIISSEYVIYSDPTYTGVGTVGSFGKKTECKCKKCGKEWTE